jgi:hypothetical protein
MKGAGEIGEVLMGEKIRGHIRSNVVGYVALFFALGLGTAWANHETIFSDDIVDEEVRSADIGNGAVRTFEIRDDTVQGLDILDSTIASADIQTGQVRSSDVLNNSLKGEDIDEGTLDTALRLDFDQPETDGMNRTVGTQNELTIKALCRSVTGETELLVQTLSSVEGGISWTLSTDTGGGAPTVTNGGAGIAAETGFEPFFLVAPTGSFRRGEAQMVYRNDNRVISLDLHMIANDSTGRCQVQGTALPAN